MSLAPTQQELNSLTAACQRLWQLDTNALQAGRDYQINPQQGKKSYMDQDMAPSPLFAYVNAAVFQQRPTYSLFHALLDNYHAQVGEAEHLTAAQNTEVQQFLDAAVQTPCMQYAHQVLVAQQLAQQDISAFKQQLYQMWFRSYTRETRDDSSGFEHVFVGEARGGKILGLHNWIQFSDQEQKHKLDYKGYIFPRVQSRGGHQEEVDANERMLSVQFSWNGQPKDISSMFIGTSPEFELALYSLCFLAGQEENIVQVGDYEVKIKAYKIKSKYGDKVGSAFPELIQKVSGRAGAVTHAPAPLHQQAPWHSQQDQMAANQYQNGQGYQNGAGYQAGYPPLQQQQQHQQAWGQQQQQQQAWGQQQQQDSAPAQQGCGNFVKSLLSALFGK